MNNKEVLKAIFSGACVQDAEGETFVRIVDYSVNADKDGLLSYAAGCIDTARVYRSVPCDQITCDMNLGEVKIGKPVWGSPYTPGIVLRAMREKLPAIIKGIRYKRICRLATILDPVGQDLRYSATCEDEQGNTVTVRLEALTIEDTTNEEDKNENYRNFLG